MPMPDCLGSYVLYLDDERVSMEQIHLLSEQVKNLWEKGLGHAGIGKCRELAILQFLGAWWPRSRVEQHIYT